MSPTDGLSLTYSFMSSRLYCFPICRSSTRSFQSLGLRWNSLRRRRQRSVLRNWLTMVRRRRRRSESLRRYRNTRDEKLRPVRSSLRRSAYLRSSRNVHISGNGLSGLPPRAPDRHPWAGHSPHRTRYLAYWVKGRLAQLVQSACLTSRRSLVRIQQRPYEVLGELSMRSTTRRLAWGLPASSLVEGRHHGVLHRDGSRARRTALGSCWMTRRSVAAGPLTRRVPCSHFR